LLLPSGSCECREPHLAERPAAFIAFDAAALYERLDARQRLEDETVPERKPPATDEDNSTLPVEVVRIKPDE
jgi:hypothetical protein